MLVIHHIEQIRRANTSRSIKVNDDLMEQMMKRLVRRQGKKSCGLTTRTGVDNSTSDDDGNDGGRIWNTTT